MDNTKIEWADATFNIISGCYHKCSYCYARGIANRFVSRKGCHLVEPETYKITRDDGTEIYEINEQPYYVDDETGKQYKCAYPHGFVPTLHRYRMEEYRNKKRQRNIFVGSMADIFGEWVPDRWIREVFNACEKAPQHNYLFLTKNPQRYFELEKHRELPWADNFWFGTTITNPNQPYTWFMEKKFHWFLSIEPLLEDLGDFGGGPLPEWIIVGAETGNRKDKVIPRREWIESIVEQCRKYNIPVFMKPSLTNIWGEELIQEFPEALIHRENVVGDPELFLSVDRNEVKDPVAYCKSKHRYLTKKQMKIHKCLQIKCTGLERLKHSYWEERQQIKDEAKRKKKQQ